MTTVQDLINLHRAAQEYEYESMIVRKVNGQSEYYFNVNNLTIVGEIISFVTTTKNEIVNQSTIPAVRQIVVHGKIIESCKRIM